MSQYNRISFKYQIITVVLAVGSAIVLFAPIKQFKMFKTFATYLICASSVSFITTRHLMRDVLDEAEKLETENAENNQKLERKVESLTNELKVMIESNEALKFEFSEQQAELSTCQQALKEARFFNKETAHDLVEECHRVALRKCECHLAALIRNNEDCESQLTAINLEIDAVKARFLSKISHFKTISAFDEVIDEGLQLQETMIVQYIELRCKAQSVIINSLLQRIEDSVPNQTFQEYIDSYKVKLNTTAQEFSEFIDDTTNLYSSRLDAALEPAKEALQQLEVTQYKLDTALERLAEYEKPFSFTGDFTPARMGNAVALYYYNRYRILLDAYDWEETEIGVKIIFSIRRNPNLVDSEMSADNSVEQIASFCNALHGTTPTWEFNRQKSRLVLTVVHRRTVKLRNELPRGVKTADKFLTTVRNWRRVRITGGSESGKSPTAENLVCALTTLHNGVCDFYDPMFDSVKNFRSIPATGRSHADSIKGLKEYQAKMQSVPSDNFYIAWFDEIDTTLDENPKSASDLKAVLKQSSHKNCGLVITGQNANVRNLKGGFDRSDMNNFVCLHIGDNYRDALANSHLSESERANLMKTGDALTDWCAFKNDEDGLELSDPAAYRFALVLEPNKKGYFMILPEFGEYVWQHPTEAIDMEPTEATEPTTPSVTVRKKNPDCPQCGGESKKNGFLKTVTPPQQRWKCKNPDCGFEFTECIH